MKIAEYNEMMAYLLRPATGDREKFDNGGYAYTNPLQKNQYIMRTDAEIQSIIDDPKYADYTKKDFRNEGILTRKETERKTLDLSLIHISEPTDGLLSRMPSSA